MEEILSSMDKIRGDVSPDALHACKYIEEQYP